MGIAHGRADILVAEQFLDLPQTLSHLVEENRGRGVAQPMRGDLPYPDGSTGGPQPQIEPPVGKRRARISCKHKLRRREGDSAGGQDPSPLEFLLHALPLQERRTQSLRDGHVLEDAPLAPDPKSHDFLPHPLAIGPRELDQLLKPASGLEEGVSQVECEGGAVAILLAFQVCEEPADVGEQQLADLGFFVERGLDLGERVFQVPVLVGKGKRGADLLEACSPFVFPH
jgi:hypothetical protein